MALGDGRHALSVVCAVVLIAAAATPAWADVELLLGDGRVIAGVAAELGDGVFHITTSGGESVTIDVRLVREVRLLSQSPAAAPDEGEPDADAAPASAPTRKPETSSNPDFRPRSASDLLEALGPAAQFPRPSIDPLWAPDDALAADRWIPEEPAWPRPTFDPLWAPDDALAADQWTPEEVVWPTSAFDPLWRPGDAAAANRWTAAGAP